jgi:glycosyltransferase involved in cell wall biosynthesis
MKRYLTEISIPEKKMMIFPMGIDASISPNFSGRFIRNKYELSSSPTVIYVGNMYKLRNLSFLLYAMSEVKKKVPNVKLLMVGDGDNRSSLEMLSKTLALEDNIIFTGSVPHSRVYEYIASGDIGVAPLVSQDYYNVKLGMCTKAIEYMLMSKAFVATDSSPDVVEIIKISNAGICTRYDVHEFATAIIDLLKNPEKANEMGKRGRQYVEKNYSFEMLANRIEQQYMGILKQKFLNRQSIRKN